MKEDIKDDTKGESYEMDDEMAVTEPLNAGNTSPSKVKFTTRTDGKNGDAKVDINSYGGSVGMSKEELMKYANDPFWVRLRMFLFILFWVIWFGMLIGAIVIIAVAPKCRATASLQWWKKTTVYQIYVRSFRDSDGDGNGDIKGIIEKLDYLKNDLGIDTIILSPFYPSPMRDGGYDVSNYTAIDPRFGTMEDFNALVEKMHHKDMNMRILIDFIPNHSSDQHMWFNESVHRVEGFEDFYVWRDAKNNTEGIRTEPNNWRSVFGGSAWEWNDIRKQYYLHQFLKSQPDLNLRSQIVKDKLKSVLQFWLKKKVDGIRIDAASHLYEDEGFEDEEINPKENDRISYAGLMHNKTKAHPENFKILSEWRKIVSQSGSDKIIITEAYETIEDLLKYYGEHSKPLSDMPFNFDFIEVTRSTNGADIKKMIQSWIEALNSLNWPKTTGKGLPWTAWVIGNHDKSRLASRVGHMLADAIHMIVFMCPHGTPVVYYGDEIGLTNNENVPSKTQDEGDPSRFGYRSLMQWNSNTESAGFSDKNSAKTWLYSNADYTQYNVEVEMTVNTTSHLKVFQELVKLRKDQAESILLGETHFPRVNSSLIFAMVRVHEESNGFLVAVNFDQTFHAISLKESYLPETGKIKIISSESSVSTPSVDDDIKFADFRIGPQQAIIVEFKRIEK